MVGLVGNVVASGIVTTLGTQKTLALFMASMLLGMTLWAVGAGWLLAMGAGISFWALGFSAINSMQQARLIAAAPDLCECVSRAQYLRALCRAGHRIRGSADYSLRTDIFHLVGYVGVTSVALACALLAATWEPAKRRQS